MTQEDKKTDRTYLWYDYETFGLEYRKDRPAQFAALRTDASLRLVGDPIVLYCRPAIDCLPDPQAVSVTGILPQECMQKGLAEPEFARRIFNEMSVPGTVHVGYNSSGFDDHVSRFLYWRNFFDPYAPEKDNGCSFYDLFKLVVAAYALRPQGIVWPVNEETGKPSFKLSALSAANHLKHTHAHDALSDVEATVELARLIHEKNPRLFDYAFTNSTKQAVSEITQKGRPVLLTDISIGPEDRYTQAYAVIAQAPGRPSDRILFNLRYAPEELLSMDASQAKDALFGKGGPQRMLKILKTNKFPFLTTSFGTLGGNAPDILGVDAELAYEREEALRRIAPQMLGIWSEAFAAKEEENSAQSAPFEVPADEGLYGGGFPSWHDKKLFAEIRGKTPEELTLLAHDGRLDFDNQAYDDLFFRYRARNYPETLTKEETAVWKGTCRARLIDGAEGARTLVRFQQEIEVLADNQEVDDRLENICGGLYEWSDFVSESLE